MKNPFKFIIKALTPMTPEQRAKYKLAELQARYSIAVARAHAASDTYMACQDRMWRIEAEIDDLLDEQGGEA